MYIASNSLNKKRILPLETFVLKFDFSIKQLFKKVQLDRDNCLQNRRYLSDRYHIMLMPLRIEYENNEF